MRRPIYNNGLVFPEARFSIGYHKLERQNSIGQINCSFTKQNEANSDRALQKKIFAVDDFPFDSYLLASRVQRRAYEIVGEGKTR